MHIMTLPQKITDDVALSNSHPHLTEEENKHALGELDNGEYRPVTLNGAIILFNFYWPALFPHGILRPMAENITDALLADKQARQLRLSNKRLLESLMLIQQSVTYQATLMPGALRYTLSGQHLGMVTDADILFFPQSNT